MAELTSSAGGGLAGSGGGSYLERLGMIDDRHPMDFGPLEDVAYLSVLVLLVTAVQYTVYGPHGDLVYWLWGGMGVVGLLLVARLRVVFRGVEAAVGVVEVEDVSIVHKSRRFEPIGPAPAARRRRYPNPVVLELAGGLAEPLPSVAGPEDEEVLDSRS